MKVEDIKQITVVGTGMIGPDVSLACTMAGYSVEIVGLNDQEVEKGMNRFRKNLQSLVTAEIFTQTEADEILARLKTSTNLPEAATTADIAFEAVFEKLEVKQEVFGQFDAHCPAHALLLSGTSGMSPNDIGANITRQHQMMVCHFWNPPYLVPLVELVAHNNASQETIDTVMAFLESMGKTPVRLKKDIVGHIGNRLQHAIFREAIHLVELGVATPEDIDQVIMNSLGPRYSMIGPMEYMDSVGLDLQVHVQSYLYETLADAKSSQKLLMEKYNNGDYGAKTGKGFYDWSSEKNLDEMVARQNKRFIDRLKALKEQQE
jgi:3-hydroxybutyryl-CoA dehydrogenase